MKKFVLALVAGTFAFAALSSVAAATGSPKGAVHGTFTMNGLDGVVARLHGGCFSGEAGDADGS